MRTLRKRFLALMLSLVMALGLLPGTAWASLGNLLDDQELMTAWEEAFGEDAEEIRVLMDSLGLLDEDGNLITDCPIVLDGEEYTLESIRELLDDPDTVLSQVAEVDGVPIALGDLKTILELEEQLLYLQETYFSGRTFEGEALENVNSLLAQLQAEGLTLGASRSTGNEIVFDTSNVQQAQNDISPIYYIRSVGDVTIPGGTTLTVKFKLNLSDAMKNMNIGTSPMVYLSDTAESSILNSIYLDQSTGANSEIVYIQNGSTQQEEYTLSIKANYEYTGPLYLCLRGPSLQSYIDYETRFAEFSFGTLWQAVSFYDANGFCFQNGTGGALSDQWTGYFSVEHTLPEMTNSASSSAEKVTTDPVDYMSLNHLSFSLVQSGDLDKLEQTLTYLQRCIDGLNADNAIRTHVSATIKQENTDDYQSLTGEQQRNLIVPLSVLLGPNSYIVANDNITGFPLDLPSGSDTADISYDIISTATSSYPSVYPLELLLNLTICKNQSVTWDQISDGDIDETYTYYVDGYIATTTKANFSLVSEDIAPTLTVTARQGTYQSGDVIPIKITGNEFIKTTSNAKVTINGTEYTLSDLHASSSGKYLTLFYEVKEIDDPKLTVAIASDSGITDYWGNAATEVNNVTVSDVTINTPVLKNAPTGLTASYDADTQQLSTTISVKQDEAYQNLYNTYQGNLTGAMQLLISVDGGEAVTRTVTMGKGDNDTFAFTAEPYTIAPTTTEQTVTVQLQVDNGSDGWTTVKWLSASTTVPALVPVTGVEISVVDKPQDYNYTIALSDENIPQLQATVTPSGAATSGTWHSTDTSIATIDSTGQIELESKTGTVSFYYMADNGTPDDDSDDKKSNELEFTITAGDELYLGIPKYAQQSLIQSGSAATVTWNTNVFEFYPDENVTFTVSLYAGATATGTPKTYTVNNTAGGERITSYTIPADDLPVTYPQSQYTVKVSMDSPEAREDTASITVLSPPTEVRLTADKTSITDDKALALTCTINNTGAAGTLAVTRMAGGAGTAVDANDCLDNTSMSGGGGAVTFTPKTVSDGLYDTYTITFTENTATTADPSFAPSTDSIVITVYRSGALDILVEGASKDSFTLSNRSVADTLPTDSQGIMALRQQLGLIEYVSINADAYNWSSFSDGIKWVSDNPDAVAVNYRQGGLWDNIEDLIYDTYLPQSQMAVSATDDAQNVTITATHDATGMSDHVTVSVETLRDKLYLFQVSPAEKATVTYFNGDGEAKQATTTDDGLLVIYEESGIGSDVYFRSGDAENPNLGTIRSSALSSGEKDAAKLQLYPLNTVTLRPAAQTELYLVKPDGTPYVGSVTLRGGVYLAGYYCEGVKMGSEQDKLVFGNTDGTYTTDADGKLTIYMDATQFTSDEYTGQLTNAELDYWFELRNLDGNKYYPTLVNIQGSMSPDYSLRTGSAVVTLQEVPEGEAETPFVIAQTLSYAQDSKDDLQVRSVLGSTGKVGPNSTYKYTELTTRVMLWGVDNEAGASTISMTGDNGYAPAAQTVDVNTFPFASIPIITNTLVLTKETMTDSGWLKAETPANLRVSVYQNDRLLRSVSMPFQVVDLTNVKLVDKDAEALVLEMKGNLVAGFGTTDGKFNFGDNMVGNAFGSKVADVLNGVQENVNPLFRVLITPSEDSSVFNVIIWGGYNSLDIDDFDYSSTGLAMDYGLMEPELDVGVPPLNDLSDMAKGTYDPIGTINETKYNRTNSGLDIGAQLEGYYEGQFYYDTDLHKWAFRTLGGGMTAGASASFQANINAWAGPVPITATFAAGIALQLDFKAATVYTDQAEDTFGWTSAALESDSVNDYLTTLRIQGYVDAFGGLGFDYSLIALKIGLFGRLTADSTNTFLSRTYLTEKSQINGQALGISGEVGIKFFAKFLFVSYETVIGSGKFTYSPKPFNDYTYIDKYWYGSDADNASFASLNAAPTLLSRAYLAAYANGVRSWDTPAFNSTAKEVLSDANPGSEPAVNDDGSLSVYISDQNSDDYFDSRIRAGAVGTEGSVIDDNGSGDMSPSLSGSGSFSVAAWIRLFEDLEKNAGDEISPAEQKQLLNSTEIMAATTIDGNSWTTTQLTDNASPDLAPVTAASGSSAIVFWRGVYTTDDNLFADEENKPDFDTQDAIYFRRYGGSDDWSSEQMVYNGSLGSVVGLRAAMLSDGTAIVVFTLDRGSNDPDAPMAGYELAYRTVKSDGTLGKLVVLTTDTETDTNPQVMAVGTDPGVFLLGWYSTRDGGDIRLKAVGADGQIYGAGSAYAVPESVRAIADEDALDISADFQFARQYQPESIDGVTLVWPEMAYTQAADGSTAADHSVLYGTRLCQVDGQFRLSSPQALITLPARTLANSFSAWQEAGGTVKAYIFGTWYNPGNTETIDGIEVPEDTDKLLTGGGSMKTQAVSVDAIFVDYAELRAQSWTPAVFTLRNTGTAALTDLAVTVGTGTDARSSTPVTLNPGESAKVTVTYKTDNTIDNPTYTISADGAASLVSDTLHLDYNDIGISSMKVVSEGEGKRTVQVTLYNDAAAKLEGSGRTVELSFYTDSEHTKNANVTMPASQTGVSVSGNTVTLSGNDVLGRIDQGSMTLLVEYDLADYVTNTLNQDEVPESGVYLYASAAVKDSSSQTMAEYATGNNDAAVQLTGAYARTGQRAALDVAQGEENGVTTARVTLTNNSLRDLESGTLMAALLDEDGNVLETQQAAAVSNTLEGESVGSQKITFTEKGSRVVVYAAVPDPDGSTMPDTLIFDGLNVSIDDFVQQKDENGDLTNEYVYELPNSVTVDHTVVTVLPGNGSDEVAVNGKELTTQSSGGSSTSGGSATVAINGTTDITVTIGGKTYTLTVTGPVSGGPVGPSNPSYPITVADSEGGNVTSSLTAARQGTTVTLTVVPEEGNQLDSLTVTDFWGNELELKDQGDGTYTFTMPGSQVEVKAGFGPADPEKLPFVDVSESAYYYDAVGWAVDNGITKGTSATLFSPGDPCTRAQMVTFLWRAAGSPEPEGDRNPFTDVSPTAYYYDAVLWAVEQGITKGTSATTFSPTDTVTRGQTVTFLWRSAGSPEASVHSTFTDVAASAYYVTAVDWAAENGITKGTSATLFSPGDPCTRAQIVTFLYRAR